MSACLLASGAGDARRRKIAATQLSRLASPYRLQQAMRAALSYRSDRVKSAPAKNVLALPMADAVWLPLVCTAAANGRSTIVSRRIQATV